MTIAILFGLAIVAAIIWRLNWKPAPSDRIPKDREDDLRKSDGNIPTPPTPQRPRDTLEPLRYCPECLRPHGRGQIHWHQEELDQLNPYWRNYYRSQPNFVMRGEHSQFGGPTQIGFWTDPLDLWGFPEEMYCDGCGTVHHPPYDMRLGVPPGGGLGLCPVCVHIPESGDSTFRYLTFKDEDWEEEITARRERRPTRWDQSLKEFGSAQLQMRTTKKFDVPIKHVGDGRYVTDQRDPERDETL